jgi:anti-sigma B factor antagonist
MRDPLVVEVDHEDEGQTLRVRPHGDIDLASISALEQCLASLTAATAELVVVDLADVAFIDSTGINAILRADADRQAHGSRVRVAHPTDAARRALAVLDLLDLVLPDA